MNEYQRGHECDFPEFLMPGLRYECPVCGVTWEQVGSDDEGFYWESIGEVDHA